jgi:hypothetical protein
LPLDTIEKHNEIENSLHSKKIKKINENYSPHDYESTPDIQTILVKHVFGEEYESLHYQLDEPSLAQYY